VTKGRCTWKCLWNFNAWWRISRRRWTGHVVSMGEKRCVYRVLVVNP